MITTYLLPGDTPEAKIPKTTPGLISKDTTTTKLTRSRGGSGRMGGARASIAITEDVDRWLLSSFLSFSLTLCVVCYYELFHPIPFSRKRKKDDREGRDGGSTGYNGIYNPVNSGIANASEIPSTTDDIRGKGSTHSGKSTLSLMNPSSK